MSARTGIRSKSRRAGTAQPVSGAEPADEICSALGRLDRHLSAAIAAFDAAHGGPVTDRFRGLLISSEQCDRLLQQEPASSVFASTEFPRTPLWPCHEDTWAQRLGLMFGLAQFDLDILLLALASEFDLRYERLFAYLQDDVTRKRPTVDFALSLLCADDGERLLARVHFAANSPLLRQGLIHLAADPNFLHPPLLAQFISPDEQLVWFLMGARGLHSELAACCTHEPAPQGDLADMLVPATGVDELQTVADRIADRAAVPPLWLHGPASSSAASVARTLAQSAGLSLLLLDASRVPAQDAERTLRLARREGWLGGALLCVDHAELWLDEPFAATRLAAVLREPAGPTLLGSVRGMPTELLGVALPVDLPLPDATQRERGLRLALSRHGVQIQDSEVRAMATRFRLTPAQISAAVADASLRSHGIPTFPSLLAAARAQSGEALALVADKVDAKATWDDIVLPDDAIAQLRELCNRVGQHDRVFNDWGFGRKLSRGRGTAALFSGGSGTGKTMAAEVIANALGLDLYRIDLARVVNKYIGETEKNLDRVFAAAEGANAILFFDEADALFGKRSEVKDAHDRYANIEVSYLLQKMEEYEGIAILASNLADSLDEAFTRRLAFQIYFPFPDDSHRLRIWQAIWSGNTPLGDEVNLGFLAREVKVAGGSIKNIALSAAYLAAAEGSPIIMNHLIHATHREFEKLGRSLPIMRSQPSDALAL